MGIYDGPQDNSKKKALKSKKKVATKNKKKTTTTATKKKTRAPRKKPASVPKTPEPAITPQQFFESIEPKPEYVKHLVTCRCSLPIFNNVPEPPDHRFIVFSELDENGDVKPSFAQCNNCDIIHRITEINESHTIKKESMLALETIMDIKPDLPDWMVVALEQHECELHVWQEARFILKHGLWGRFIVLAKEKEDDYTIGKIMQILGHTLYKIETFEREDKDV